MPKLGAVKFAYAVLAVERRADPSVDLTHAPAAPQIGDIEVYDVQLDGESVIQERDHKLLVDIVHLRFIGRGRELPGGDVDFDYETRRLLALIQIGAQNERAVHNLVDQIFERIEEAFFNTGAKGYESALAGYRKEFP